MKMKKTMVAAMVASTLLLGCRDGRIAEDSGSTSTSTYTLTVTVTDEITGSVVEGADVIVDGETQTTDANGLAYFTLSTGNYTVEVDEAAGYFNEYGSITVSSSNVSVSYELEEYDADATDGESASIAVSGEDDTFSMKYWGDNWGSGTTIVDVEDSTYEKAYELTSGSDWGEGADFAAMAWGNDLDATINIIEYTKARFLVKTTSYSSVDVIVQSATETESVTTVDLDSLATTSGSLATSSGSLATSSSEVADGWTEVEITLPDFDDMTWFAIRFEGQGTAQIAEVSFESTREGTPAEDDSDTSDDTATSTDSVAYSATSGAADGVTFAEPGWGSGSYVVDADKTDEGNYDHVMEWAMGDGWAADDVVENRYAVANSIDGLSGISDYTTFNVKFKYTDTNSETASNIEIQMPGYTTQTIYETGSEWTELSDGWVQVSVPVSAFEISESANPSQMVLILKDDASNPVYFTDINFSGYTGSDDTSSDDDSSSAGDDSGSDDSASSGDDSGSDDSTSTGDDSGSDDSTSAGDDSGSDDSTSTDDDSASADDGSSSTGDDSSSSDDTTTATESFVYSASSGATEGLTFTEPGWGSGSSLTDIDKTDEGNFGHVMEWAMGDGWGGPAVANSIDGLSGITGYTTFNVKFKYTDTNSATAGTLEIQMPGYTTKMVYDTDTEWTALDNGWIQVSVAISDFAIPEGDNPIQMVLIVKDDASNPVYFTDISFSSGDSASSGDDSGSSDETATSTGSVAYSASSGATEGLTFTEPGWGSGSSLTDIDKTDEGNYDHVMEWAMGDGWGGPAVANSIDGLSGITGYTTFNVKFKYTDTNSATAGTLEIQMPGYTTKMVYDTDTEWTALDNGWIQVSVPVSDFAIPEDDNPTQMVLIVKDDASNPVYFTDINFTGGESSDDASSADDASSSDDSGADDASSSDGTATDTGSVAYSATSGATSGLTFTEPGWGSGSSLTDIDKTDEGNYDHVMEWAMGDGWGGPAVANSIDGLSGITGYTTFNVKFKYTDTNSASAGTLEIQVPGYTTQTIYDTDTAWTALSNGWIQVSVAISGFAIPEGDNPTQMVLIVKDDASNPVYFTDINFE